MMRLAALRWRVRVATGRSWEGRAAPLRASVVTAADKFRLLSGEPAAYVKVAKSGNKRAQTFCPRCGSPLYATSPDDPNALRMVRLGIVRQRDQLAPKR